MRAARKPGRRTWAGLGWAAAADGAVRRVAHQHAAVVQRVAEDEPPHCDRAALSTASTGSHATDVVPLAAWHRHESARGAARGSAPAGPAE